MNKEENVINAYELAKEKYSELGVDTEEAIKDLEKVKLSIHSW